MNQMKQDGQDNTAPPPDRRQLRREMVARRAALAPASHAAHSAAIVAHSTGYSEETVRAQFALMGLVEHRPGRFIYGKGFKREELEKPKEKESRPDTGSIYHLGR